MTTAILLLLLLGIAVRGAAFAAAGAFQPDEALFATFAREIVRGDFFLAAQPLDKPPLALYFMALSFDAFGAGEFAARLPNFFASAVTLAAVWALARTLYGRRAAIFALAFAALSPFAAAFAPTAYMDPLMTCWLALGCLAAARKHPGWAGAACGLALMSKPTALWAFPLVIMIGVIADPPESARRMIDLVLRFGAGPLSAALLLGIWNAQRGGADFWALGAAHNDPGRFIRANEVGPRLGAWLNWLRWFFGSDILSALMFVLIPLTAIMNAHRFPRTRPAAYDVLLLTFIIAYLGAHWLIAFNTYDRYLFIVWVPVMVLAGRGAARFVKIR